MDAVMKAVRYARYGGPDVLEWREVPRPQPGPGEVLVRVAAAAINPKDCLVRKGRFRAFTRDRLPRGGGYDFSGTVAELGPGVHGLSVGDRVFGMLNGWDGGSFAEYLLAPVDELAAAPATIGLEDAAGLPLAGQTALQALRDRGDLRAGQSVLINGAAGGVGTLAVQLAKSFGARVTAVCSARNADFVRALGADEVIDYQGSDITRLPARYDFIFDVYGNHSYAALEPLLKPRGRYVATVPTRDNLLRDAASRVLPWLRGRLVLVRSRRADLDWLRQRVDGGALRPVTERTWPMAQAAEAQRHVETRRARGKVLLIP